MKRAKAKEEQPDSKLGRKVWGRMGCQIRFDEYQPLVAAAARNAAKHSAEVPAQADVHLTYRQLCEHGYISYSRIHLYRLMARGLFPLPIVTSPNRRAWKLSDIIEWQRTRPVAQPPKLPNAA